jgi:hypothetical protein
MLSTPALAAVAAAAASALVVAAFAPDASAEVVTPPLATSPGQTLDMCKASAPKAGATIEGTVLHVVDDRSLCIAMGATPDAWVPLIIEGPSPVDHHDPMVTKAALMSAVFAKKMSCKITSTEAGVAHAACSIDRMPVRQMVANVTPAQAALWLPTHT